MDESLLFSLIAKERTVDLQAKSEAERDALVAGFSALIVLNFGTLFGWAITVSTRYSQPALGILICIFAGWLWQRDTLLQELQKNDTDAEQRLFWKIWPFYVKWLCPGIIGVILAQSIL